MSQVRRILIVDDDGPSRMVAKAIVESLGHEPELAVDGIEALAKLKLDIDLVLLDVMMPAMDGFDVTRRIREDLHGADIPIIIVTALNSPEDRIHAIELGANDFVTKPYDKTELRARTASLLKLKEAQDSLKGHQAELERMVERRTAMLREALQESIDAHRSANQAQLDTVERLAAAAEYKDKVTALHIQRMSGYAAILARGLKLVPGDVELIQHASRMHDVGKIGIPDAILRKPCGLDDTEWQTMRQHTMIGDRILAGSSSKLLQAGQVIAASHHEWWDGSGYPRGLGGEAIPFWGRICAVADAFDAITSERPYKHAFSNDEAYEILLRERGTHFDPRVVDVFFERLEEVLAVQHQLRDDVLKGKVPRA